MSIETIFDYSPTQGELNRFCIIGQEEIDDTKRRYTSNPKKWHDSINWQLGMLFYMRNDDERANSYFSKIHDKSMLSTLIEDYF